MSSNLYPYYERELLFIRQFSQEFAKQYPATANRLLLEPGGSSDPHTERLIESFALLAARVHHKLDDEFPELTDALLSVLYPHYLAPIPSMAIVEFVVDPARADLPEGFLIDRNSVLRTNPVNDLPCKYRTTYPVKLWPVVLTNAALLMPPFPPGYQPPARTAAALSLQFEVQAGMRLDELSLDRLRFYLSGDNQVVAALYELIFNHTLQVVFRSLEFPAGSKTVALPAEECLFQVGFERDEGILPYPQQSFLGYRLLTEFFTFPSKFLFVDLAGFQHAAREGMGTKFEVILFLNRRQPGLEQGVDAQTFRLGCTPAVNLFEQLAEPIRLTQSRFEYRVVPDVAHPLGMEVYSVDSVTSIDPESNKTTEYQPFYSFRHAQNQDNLQTFWYAPRKPSTRENDRGSDVFLHLVDLGFNPRLPAEATLVVRTTCSNRNLPAILQRAGEQLAFELDRGPPGPHPLPPAADVAAATDARPRRSLAAHLALEPQSSIAVRPLRSASGASRNSAALRFLVAGDRLAVGIGDALADRRHSGRIEPPRRRADQRRRVERFRPRRRSDHRVRRAEIHRHGRVAVCQRAGTLPVPVHVDQLVYAIDRPDGAIREVHQKMAAAGRRTTNAVKRSAPWTLESLPARSVAARLFKQFYQFDFFQAVRMLEQLAPERIPVGHAGPPWQEVVRFKAHTSLSFPPSVISNLTPPGIQLPPTMTVPFMGLTGPSGVLPRHYTELLLRIEKELKTPEKYALRDWFDLFNHRFLSLFFRAWEKYRFDVTYGRRHGPGSENELFAHVLSSLIGLGMPSLQNRLRVVSCWDDVGALSPDHAPTVGREERVLAKVEHLAMVYYSGLLSHRPRNALGLEAMLHDYFRLPVRIRQFQGHWVQLEDSKQSRLGEPSGYALLGGNAVVGERVWDVQGKIRVRLGPLTYAQFQDLLPDREPFPERKTFFELAHLVRFYVGVELTFDLQLVLLPDEVPECRLADGTGDGPQLGWNTWLQSQSFAEPVEDAVFDGEEIVCVNRPPDAVSNARG